MNTVSDEMRNTIICKAGELFSRYGYKKTTMDILPMPCKKGKAPFIIIFKTKRTFLGLLSKRRLWKQEVLFKNLWKKNPLPKTN